MIEEYKAFADKLVCVYNDSNLPAFIKEYVIRDLYAIAQQAKREEMAKVDEHLATDTKEALNARD